MPTEPRQPTIAETVAATLPPPDILNPSFDLLAAYLAKFKAKDFEFKTEGLGIKRGGQLLAADEITFQDMYETGYPSGGDVENGQVVGERNINCQRALDAWAAESQNPKDPDDPQTPQIKILVELYRLRVGALGCKATLVNLPNKFGDISPRLNTRVRETDKYLRQAGDMTDELVTNATAFVLKQTALLPADAGSLQAEGGSNDEKAKTLLRSSDELKNIADSFARAAEQIKSYFDLRTVPQARATAIATATAAPPAPRRPPTFWQRHKRKIIIAAAVLAGVVVLCAVAAAFYPAVPVVLGLFGLHALGAKATAGVAIAAVGACATLFAGVALAAHGVRQGFRWLSAKLQERRQRQHRVEPSVEPEAPPAVQAKSANSSLPPVVPAEVAPERLWRRATTAVGYEGLTEAHRDRRDARRSMGPSLPPRHQ